MDFNKTSHIIGIVAIFAILQYLWKLVAKKAETSVISKEGLNILENPDKKKELREAVDKYHRTGDWSQTQLKNIF